MDFVSLELNRRIGQTEEISGGNIDLVDQMRMLICGIGLHSIESEPEDFNAFQRQLAEIASRLHADCSNDELMNAIVQTLRAMESYNRKAGAVFTGQVEELRGMVSSMTETLQFVVSSSEVSMKQLGFMESQLKRAGGLEDLRQLRTYTSACLSLVRKESSRLQTETQSKVESLRRDVEKLSNRIRVAAAEQSEDPVTGLPGRASAEQAIEDKISASKPCVAALFLMDRLASVNAKYGNVVGDEVIMSCAHLLAQRLHGATLYRWSGPGFLALFDPLIPAAEAEARSRQAAAQRLEKNIDAEGRVLMVVIGFTCNLQPVNGQTKPDELFRQLDGLMVASQS